MANCAQCGRKLPGLTFGKKICVWCKQHEAAQHGEVDDDDARQPVMAVPWARRRQSTITLTHILFGANVAVFIAMVAASGSIEAFPGPILGHFGANYGPYTLSGDWWRLVTYMFVHADIFHIGFNMWCLWTLGNLCESLYGGWTFGAIYFIAGISGGLARVAWDPMVPSVGASGAIFGLAGALIASFYLGEFSLPSFVIQANLRSLLFFAGFNILFGISPIGDLFGIHVDNACHIGGLVSGLILGALIAVIAPRQDSLRRVGVIAAVALTVLGSAYGIQRWRGERFRVGRAFAALSENKPGKAIADLQAIVRQRPNLADAHYALAHAYFMQEDYPHSESEFRRVLELSPHYVGARFNLGLVYLSEHHLDDAKTAFTQVLANDPNDADAHYGLGLVLEERGDYRTAIEEFKIAIGLGPQVSGVYAELGNAYAHLKMYDDAIAAYVQSRERDGDNPDLENALAECYQVKGRTQQAQEARTRAAQLRAEQHP